MDLFHASFTNLISNFPSKFVSFQETKEKEAAELGMKNVGGVFLVLAAGLSIACIIACVERYWVSRRKRVALKLVSILWRVGAKQRFWLYFSVNK